MVESNYSNEEIKFKEQYCDILEEGIRRLGRSNSFEDFSSFNKIYNNLGVVLVDIKLEMGEKNISIDILGTLEVLSLEMDRLLLINALGNKIYNGVYVF